MKPTKVTKQAACQPSRWTALQRLLPRLLQLLLLLLLLQLLLSLRLLLPQKLLLLLCREPAALHRLLMPPLPVNQADPEFEI